MEQPEDIESAWANILNGTMIALLGAAISGFITWTTAVRWREIAATAAETFSANHWSGVGAIIYALWALTVVWIGLGIIRHGLRLVWRSAAWIRRR